MRRRKSKYSPAARRYIGKKIRRGAHEGIEAPRRIARALAMARARGLKVPRRPNAGVPEERPAEHLRNALAILLAHEYKTPHGVPMSTRLEPEDVQAVIARIRTALEQIEHGHGHVTTRLRGNPTLAILGANPRVEDATRATWAKIEYIRPDDPDGSDIIRVHEFKDGFEIGWLSDGSVQLSHPQHALWVED